MYVLGLIYCVYKWYSLLNYFSTLSVFMLGRQIVLRMNWCKIFTFCVKRKHVNERTLEEVDYCCEAKCCILGPKGRDVVDGIACKKCWSFCECYCRCKTWMRSKEYKNLKKKKLREKKPAS